MDARCFAWRVSLCLVSLALAACGGGGSGGALPPASSGGAPVAPPPSGSAGPASVAVSIAIPSAGASAVRRSPRYVSAATKSVAVSFAGNRQVADCTSTCSVVLTVDPGTVTFVFNLYDAAGGTGHVLSTGSTTAAVVGGRQNTVNVTFAGVVAKVAVALGTSAVTAGTAASIPVTVSAQDAAGYTIVGPEPYSSPIALALDDPTGSASLSAGAVSAPGAAVTLAYSGGGASGTVRVSASASGVAAQVATLAVQPASAPPPPSGDAPDHVKNFAFYGINDVNANVPAAYMAAHVDMVEDDGYTAQHADAFKRAGGKFAIAYTDPTYVPHCPPPFTPPAGRCTGPIGVLVPGDESAFVHDANGARVNRFVDNYFQYQEVLNPASASARNAYAQTVAAVVAKSPLLDGLHADDAGSSLNGADGVFGSSLYYGFNTTGVEIKNDADWIAGHSGMLAAAGKPLILNGGDSVTWGPAYGGAFLDLPSVMGQMFEGCFNNGGNYLYTDQYAKFQREVDALLTVQAHHKIALCLPTGSATDTAKRMYAYASFLLAYDPTYSLYGMMEPQSDGNAVYPETQLVPQQPLRTASAVAQLKTGGVYVREFGACSVAGKAIGPCAAVVNSAPSSSAAIPALSTAYAHSVVLDAKSLYGGGTVGVAASAPTSLPAQSAAILTR
jgi:Hypothetical glycosyl hydrolase family 15